MIELDKTIRPPTALYNLTLNYVWFIKIKGKEVIK